MNETKATLDDLDSLFKTTETVEPPVTTIVVSDPKTTALVPVLPALQSVEMKRVVDIIKIPEEQRVMAEKVAEAFDFDDTNAVITFGVAAQRSYLEDLKVLLGHAKVKDAGLAGDATAMILRGIDMVQLDKMKAEITDGSVWKWLNSHMPEFIARQISAIRLFAARQEDLYDLVEDVENKIQEDMRTIVEENARMDVMFKKVLANFMRLAVYIYSGEKALDRGKREFNELRESAVTSGDAVEISKANLRREQLIAFDARLLRMKSAYVEAPVTLQENLTIQQASRIELQNQVDSLLFDLPKFVDAIITMLAVFNLEKVQARRKARQELGHRLAEIKGNAVEKVAVIAKQDQALGIKEAEEVEKYAAKLIGTIKKVSEIEQQNIAGMQKAENLLVDVSDSFRNAMIEASKPMELT